MSKTERFIVTTTTNDEPIFNGCTILGDGSIKYTGWYFSVNALRGHNPLFRDTQTKPLSELVELLQKYKS